MCFNGVRLTETRFLEHVKAIVLQYIGLEAHLCGCGPVHGLHEQRHVGQRLGGERLLYARLCT